MRTIDRNPAHEHRFMPRGAHTLHAGYKPRGQFPYPELRLPIREVRLVRLCTGCPELRVDVSRHYVLGRREVPCKTTPR